MTADAALKTVGSQDDHALADSFQRDGYAVLPGLLDRRTVQAVRDELAAACLKPSCGTSPAPAPPDAALAEFSCLQFPHLASARFLNALLAPPLVDVLRRVLGPALKLMQSIVLLRRGGTPGMDWHQDRHYLDTGGNRLVAAWVALDDARADNGCLRALPGSHRAAMLWPHTALPDGGFRAHGFPFDEDQPVVLNVDAGTAILFDGHLLHRSALNRRKSGFRRALIGHFSVEGTPSQWDGDNQVLPLGTGGQIEIVTGAAPYAHRG